MLDIPITFIGLRPGEKLYEELLTEEEERTQKVADRIFAAQSPAPPGDLEQRLDELSDAARAEDPALVLALLRALVPSYRDSTISTFGAAGVPAESGKELAGTPRSKIM